MSERAVRIIQRCQSCSGEATLAAITESVDPDLCPFDQLASEIEEITLERFTAAVGREPEHDDLARSRCPRAGQVGHLMCGWCKACNKPVFICGHPVQR